MQDAGESLPRPAFRRLAPLSFDAAEAPANRLAHGTENRHRAWPDLDISQLHEIVKEDSQFL